MGFWQKVSLTNFVSEVCYGRKHIDIFLPGSFSLISEYFPDDKIFDMLFNGKNLSFCLFKDSHLTDITQLYTQLLRYKMGTRRGRVGCLGCAIRERHAPLLLSHQWQLWVANETSECVSLEREGVCLLWTDWDQLWLAAVSCVSSSPGSPVTPGVTHLELGDGRVDQRRLRHPHVELLLLEHRRVIVHIPEPNVNLLVTRPEIWNWW